MQRSRPHTCLLMHVSYNKVKVTWVTCVELEVTKPTININQTGPIILGDKPVTPG